MNIVNDDFDLYKIGYRADFEKYKYLDNTSYLNLVLLLHGIDQNEMNFDIDFIGQYWNKIQFIAQMVKEQIIDIDSLDSNFNIHYMIHMQNKDIPFIKVIEWLECEKNKDSDFPYCFPDWFVEHHKQREKSSIDIQQMREDYPKLKEDIKKLKEEKDEPPRVIDEKLLAYLLIIKFPELKNNQDWDQYFKNKPEKGTLHDQMKNYGLNINDKSMNEIIKRACARYLECKGKKN